MAVQLSPFGYADVREVALARALDGYVAHHGLAPHTLHDLAAALRVPLASASSAFFAWLWVDLKLPEYEPSPVDAEVITDEETILAAWRTLGEPVPFPSFSRALARMTNPADPSFDARLVPLVARDDYISHAAAAGARGTDYSCEQCRADQVAMLLRRAERLARTARRAAAPRVH